MRWLTAFIVFDLAIIAWLAAGRGVQDTADFVFLSPSEHHWLDPQRMSWRHDFRIIELLFEPLVKYQLPQMTIEPGVAAAWERSDDGLTYTFDLRPEARWSNGDPVTAHDFVYAWRRAILPDFASDYAQLLFVIDGAEAFFTFRGQQLAEYAQRPVGQRTPAAAEALWNEAQARFVELVGLSAPDDQTLVVRLGSPTPYFLELCAFGTLMPVHPASVDRQVTINPQTGLLVQDPTWTRPGKLVCNGPYVMTRRRYKRDLLMEASPTYHDRARVGPGSILERIVTDKQLQVLLYRGGEADFVPDVPTASALAADLVAEGRDDVHVQPAAGTYFYSFNCQPTRPDGTPNPLHDPRVRRALSLAIDRETIVKHVTRMNQPVARTFVPVGALPGYEPPVEAGPRYDLAEARRLLAEAGYPDGRGLTGLKILFNTGQGHENIAQQIQRNWGQNLGVAVSLDTAESSVFGHRLRNQDYLIARASWFGDYRDPSTFLDKYHSGNSGNDARYSNPAYDALLERAAQTTDPAQRMAIFRQAEAILLADAPLTPIYQYADLMLFRPDQVKNLHLNAWNFRRLELVQVRRDR